MVFSYLTGRPHGYKAPAVLAGSDPGFLEMVTGGFTDNNTLGRARGAGEPDHVPGSRTRTIGIGNLLFHCTDTLYYMISGRRRIAADR